MSSDSDKSRRDRSPVSLRKGPRYVDAVVAAPVTIPYSRFSTHGAHWFAARALAELLESSGLDKSAIDGLCFTSFTLLPDTAVGLTQHLNISLRWLDHIPMGGAAGIVALRRASRAVEAGDAQVVACIAADTNRADTFNSTLGEFSQFSQDAVWPYGAGGPSASFALLTDYYMREYGARREDFGKLCVAQRENARSFPHALLRKPLTLEEYLNARLIAEPLRLFDCVMPCAGAEAFLVMSQERARDLGLRFVNVLSTCERHNAFAEDAIQMRGGWALDRDALFARAGIRHEHVDFVQTYDDYPVISMLQFEDLGFCSKGEGPQFVRDHTFTLDGSFPHNTSGGQLSVGQAGAAGGFLGMTDAIRQLTGAALGATVGDANVALVSGFGMINYDRGLCCGAAILGRDSG
ncbi:MAG: thiolase family protein [Steroidobacteraceae bacterium]